MYAAVPANMAMVMTPPHIVLGLGSIEYLSTCMQNRVSQCRYVRMCVVTTKNNDSSLNTHEP